MYLKKITSNFIFRTKCVNVKRFQFQTFNLYKIQNKYCTLADTTPKCIFSGIQPTGVLHLGNYFGAILQWVDFQNTEESVIYCIADLHSITSPQDPSILKKNIYQMTATLLSCGISPDKSILFQQSRVSQHVELCWVLGSLTTMARLGHLPQFKEKSARLKEVPLGIFIYPVLQAADILLYKGTHVPVGEDQLQHLQLAQHLARTFNNRFGETFPVPKAIIGEDSIGRLKSLRDPLKKMSKSDSDPRSRIELTDSSEAILDKCKKAITDFTSAVTFDPRERPGIANLITIHSMLSGISPEDICKDSAHLDTGKYKLVVAKVVEDKLSPIREKIRDLMSRPQHLEDVLEEGAEKASSIAELTWQDVKTKIGFKLS